MAEHGFNKNLNLKSFDVPIPDTISYNPPDYLDLHYDGTQAVLNDIAQMKFYVDPKSGHIKMPNSLDKMEVYSRTGRTSSASGIAFNP